MRQRSTRLTGNAFTRWETKSKMEGFAGEHTIPTQQTNDPPLGRSLEIHRREPYVHKACESCRAAKVKCSGNQPCTRCQHRKTKCSFRRSLRRRPGTIPLPASPPVPAEQESPPWPEPTASSSASPVPVGPLLPKTLFKVLRITHQTSNGTFVALRGPETNFATYQLIHDLFHPGPRGGTEQYADGNAAADFFQYRALIFAPPDSPWDLLPITTIANEDLRFVPAEMAMQFFEIYASILWDLSPLPPVDRLRSCLCDLFGVVGAEQFSSIERANVLTMLAVAATCTAYNSFREFIYQKSRQYADVTAGFIDIAAIQNDWLQAQYHTHLSHYALAYEALGRAGRNLTYAGINPSFLTAPDMTEPSAPDVHRTFLAVFSFERFICLSIGRPSYFADELCPADSELSLIHSSTIKFAIVAAQIVKAQHTPPQDIESLVHTSKTLHIRLDGFLSDASEKCQVACADDHGRFAEIEIIMCVLFHYALQVVYRPFLKFRLLHHHPESFPSPEVPIPNEWLGTVEVESQYAVQAARSTIRLIGWAVDCGSTLKDIPLNGLFIENACLSLILASVASNKGVQYLDDVHTGMNYLAQIACQPTVAARLSSLEIALSTATTIGVGAESSEQEDDDAPRVRLLEQLMVILPTVEEILLGSF
ncbi:hypothetical protein BO71DRAFT_124245 [Aspergillus ellipticus CBS 707.79]|uniref:Zn(2)-C6 fungal-type domain-containing protein n=1 Tax=Aspergillus ellipticus CBS 707.79 TaxID=1448320 RepID=A0A319CUN1_9EURO|nr:hypothetical protein BO71DRAFT_124245 [Aspergillus ellipticus CBS 707.79]